MKSARSKACDISQKVKERVWERDEHKCVICGSYINVMPNAHYIRRSHGGLGIEENIFTACTPMSENNCHYRFDNDALFRDEVGVKVREHFKNHYPDWDEDKLYYKKYDF